MSRYALRRMAPLLHGRMQLRRHQMPLSSAAEEPLPDAVHMTGNCIRRLKELRTTDSSNEGKMLRLGVETGGCSGFQYVFCLDDKKNSDDRLEIACLLRIHDIMLLDVVTNPSAVGGCSCKSSFMVK
ncbi:hypothetical protein C4D60_Mb05t00820 [Musa balbisiana]|uniref:FeS cluster biogenesis domain-containing protein n=1 Tax=Musa balbisiana TaxID=52838 RepID=A0A4S8JST4_MUSBA|nr:hypothetical protein C4D60_Mb05t00820 [Musa balbisiana]